MQKPPLRKPPIMYETTLIFFSLFFLGKSKENHRKKQGFFVLSAERLKYQGNERKTLKKQGNSLQRKNQGNPKKQGKEDQGKYRQFCANLARNLRQICAAPPRKRPLLGISDVLRVAHLQNEVGTQDPKESSKKGLRAGFCKKWCGSTFQELLGVGVTGKFLDFKHQEESLDINGSPSGGEAFQSSRRPSCYPERTGSLAECGDACTGTAGPGSMCSSHSRIWWCYGPTQGWAAKVCR